MKKIIFSLFTVLLSTSLFAVVKVEDTSNLKILTPTFSQRKESKLRLDNKLEVYLISDPSTHDSGAALSVEAGSFDDPKDYPGMAHFVEHMLFMGTEKYPQEGGFHSFISSHSGTHNAFTTEKRTVFVFSVENGAFKEALDQFSQFFISPLFSSDCLARECHAVDEEYSKDLTLDTWRILHVKKALSHPSHPFHCFCIGNKETLSAMPSEKMREWYGNHYSSSLMHLVVYSSLPIEELEELAIAYFSPVTDHQITPACCHFPLFSPATESTLVAIQPNRKVEKLELTWELPRNGKETREEKPEELIAHVLGYEGSGSLLSELKKEELATTLSTDVDWIGREERIFTLSINLTEKGIKNYETVIARVFQTIHSLQKSGIPKYIFEEMERIKKLEYAFQQKEELFSLLSDLAYKLPDEDLSTFPRLSLSPTKFDEKKVKELLATLTPSTCRYFLIVPQDNFSKKMDQIEKWMGVNFALLPLEKRKMTEWAELSPSVSFGLPKPNCFLPEEVIAVAQREEKKSDAILPSPHLLVNSEKAKVYFATDKNFLVPEIEWIFTFKTPSISDNNPLSCLFADLYVKIAREHLREIAYDAAVAHLNYALTPTHNGLKLEIQGFSEKASLFYSQILEKLSTLKPTEEEFRLYKKELEKEYDNQANESPLAQAKELTLSILYKDYAGPTLKANSLGSAHYQDFVSFSDHLFKEGFLEATLFGNIEEPLAKELIENWETNLSYHPSQKNFPSVEMALLPDCPTYIAKKSELLGNALILVIGEEPFTSHREAVARIFAQALQEPFFSEMRSKQETAYLVRNYAKEMERHLYLFFFIQSSSHDPRDLLSRFELFFENELRDFSTHFSEASFESIRNAEILSITNMAENISDTGRLMNRLAFDYDGDFAWQNKQIEALKSLTYEEFKKEAHSMIGRCNGRRLACGLLGKMPEGNEGLFYQRISSLKKIRNEIQYRGREAQAQALKEQPSANETSSVSIKSKSKT